MSRDDGMINIAVLASGSGTNFEAIAASVDSGEIPGRIAVLISDNPGAFALERAKRRSINTRVVLLSDYEDRHTYDRAIVSVLQTENIDLVVLAGYMKLVGPEVLEAYSGRIMNIHPSLLPSFPGTDGVGDALEYGVKVSGVTVHFVDAGLDTGPIIAQEAVVVEEGDGHESLHNRIHESEYRIYPRAIALFAEGRLKIEGRKVRILKEGDGNAQD